MSSITIDPLTKLECLERELHMRKVVYPKRVAEGKMSQRYADRQIMIIEAIVDDYRGQVEDHDMTVRALR
jgi:hypothetical protein